MGEYDSVFVECPECGYDLEFQSKVGDCNLKAYEINAVPIKIAVDLDGDIQRCVFCNNYFRLQYQFPFKNVSMNLIKE